MSGIQMVVMALAVISGFFTGVKFSTRLAMCISGAESAEIKSEIGCRWFILLFCALVSIASGIFWRIWAQENQIGTVLLAAGSFMIQFLVAAITLTYPMIRAGRRAVEALYPSQD